MLIDMIAVLKYNQSDCWFFELKKMMDYIDYIDGLIKAPYFLQQTFISP